MLHAQNSRLAAFRVEEVRGRKRDWKELADAAFRVYGVMREAIRKENFSIDHELKSPGPKVRHFAQGVTKRLEEAAAVHGMQICVLNPDAIATIPGTESMLRNRTIAFGLERADGKITPLVFDQDRVIVQNGGEPHEFRYGAGTDFARILKHRLGPESFM